MGNNFSHLISTMVDVRRTIRETNPSQNEKERHKEASSKPKVPELEN
jgi:hypothetical protein